MKQRFAANLRRIMGYDRVVARLIAAWCCFAALVLMLGFGFDELKYAQGMGFGQLALGVALFFVVLSLVALPIPELPTDSWFLFAAATVCVCRWLLEYESKNNEFLFVLAVLVAYCLFTVWCYRANADLLRRFDPDRRAVMGIALLLGAASCAMIAAITCLRYKTFSSPNFDFGLFCNMFHNMKESGLPMVTSERDRLLSHFAVHISPVYYLLLPFYCLFPSPMTLQIGQAVALALGVIPVVLLAQHHRLSGKLTLLVAALYAFYPAISTGCFYDLHENCFLPLFLLLTFLFYEKKKYIPMYISALFVLSIKEDAAVYLLFFALFVLLSERNYLHGAILAAMSVGYFALCAHWLQAHGEGMMINRFNNLIYDQGDGLLGAIKTALVNPGYLLTQLFTTGADTWEKIVYVLQMLLPLGLLPFCSKKPSRWLLVAPLLINLLTYYVYQYDLGFQYHFGITAFLFYAMIKNLPELSLPARETLLSVAAASCCCIYLFSVVPFFNNYHTRWQSGKETYLRMEAALDTIPEDASVCVSAFLLAHIADRDEIYEIKYHGNQPDVDYVVLDMRDKDSYEDALHAYLAHGYTVTAVHDNLITVMAKPAS